MPLVSLRPVVRAALVLPLLAAAPLARAAAQPAPPRPPRPPAPTRPQFPAAPPGAAPELASLVATRGSELAGVVDRFSADQASMARRYDGADSPDQRRRMRPFLEGWRAQLRALDFGRLSREGQVDYLLLDNHLQYQLALLERRETQRRETAPLMPFADALLALHDARRNLETLAPGGTARQLAAITRQVDSLRALLEPAPPRAAGDSTPRPARPALPALSRTVANRAAEQLDQLRGTMGGWYRYAAGYDPVFTWWMTSPWQQLDEALRRYAQAIRQRLVGITVVAQGPAPAPGGTPAGGGRGEGNARNAAAANEPIIGDPIGAAGLAADLRHAMIPYSAEELIALAEREYAFSEAEARKAARQMGFGDDWKAAMEKVKDAYVEPGAQPGLIRDLANEAEAFFDRHDWVTIPALAREDWRMEMLSPERQRVSPFFLGGESILVSYPTAEMTDDEKRMSLRGNTPHFSRAVVFHELNPGHHLQGFMTARYHPQRRLFGTPFWNEGQSLYWEMFLWDRDFHVTPEDRLGALAWRMHRSARIVFSLSFHLGRMTAQQCIDYLVDKVPFEKANSEAEVRRSFNGSYPPIYQAAYMLGGLQLRALYRELVTGGRMTDRQFHDAVLQGGPMPIAMVRARLGTMALSRDGVAPWRFAEQLPAPRPFPVR